MRSHLTARPLESLFLIVVATASLSACSTVVDAAEVESDLKTEIPEIIESDMPVTSVSCPEDPEATDGTTFTCDYTVEDGTKGTASVTVTTSDDNVNLDYGVSRPASGQVQQFLLNNIQSDTAITSVACPDSIEDGTVCTFEDKDGDTGTSTLSIDADDEFGVDSTYD